MYIIVGDFCGQTFGSGSTGRKKRPINTLEIKVKYRAGKYWEAAYLHRYKSWSELKIASKDNDFK